MKYKLECTQYDGAKVTFEFEAEGLDVLLEQYGYFLKACGFIIKGTVDITCDSE